MKVWLTDRYPTSSKLRDAECRVLPEAPSTIEYLKDGSLRYVHGEGRNWHRTPEAARVRLDIMRHNKIASLRRQIAKLERMKFTNGDAAV